MLHPFLVFDVLLNHCEGSTTNRGDKVRIRPEGRKPRGEPGELLPEQSRGTAFDSADQAMNPVLGIDFHEEMHVFRHDCEFKNLGIMFSTDNLYNRFKPGIDARNQYRTSILRTPDHVIFAGVDHVVIRFVTDGVG
jgi:hypothetical protein